jgi:ketosteroid isomerase-like protein
MSADNVEIRNEAARAFLMAFEGDDDAFRETLHPEIEWYPIEENRTPTRGVEAALWNRNQWLDTWDDYRQDVDEVIEDGDDVVVGIHIRARGRRSGVEADLRFYVQVKVRDGKVAYIYDHDDRAAALKAAGLAGEVRSPSTPRRPAMSRGNQDTLRLFYEVDLDGEEILELLDPAVELFPGIRTPDQRTRYVGREAWREFIREAFEAWESVDIEPRERLEATSNRILAIDIWRFSGRQGIEIESELPTLFTFRDELIVRIDGFRDKAEALRVAGLGE